MNYKKKQKIYCILFQASLLLTILGCSFLDDPTGSVEILDVYTRNEQEYIDTFSFYSFGTSTSEHGVPKTKQITVSYLCTTVLITNTCNKNIYNTTINVKAKAGERTYYKTISLDVTITPGNSIYIPVEIEKNTRDLIAVNATNDSDWDINSIEIISVSWR